MSASAAPGPVKGHCPECGPDRLANVVAQYHSRYDDEESGVWGETDYRILQCRGCEAVYFQTDAIFFRSRSARPHRVFVARAIVEFGRARAFVCGHSLGVLQRALRAAEHPNTGPQTSS
jgi:hypothetical protein